MNAPLPQFDDPPVIETVLGVQFERHPDFSPAHGGWFWREVVPSWPKAKEVPRLQDQFERFDAEHRFGIAGITLRPPGEPERIQLINPEDDRMIQIQDSRFHLNWRKRKKPYPNYERLVEEFRSWLERYRSFAVKAGLGELNLNQWEITYINHIPNGPLWNMPSDFPKLLPGLYAEPPSNGWEWDHIDGDWRFTLPGNRGRLHVSAKHGYLIEEPKTELLIYNLTARGPVETDKQSWESGLNLGHEAIVRFFTATTSAQAHQAWKRRA